MQGTYQNTVTADSPRVESNVSAVSWGAVIAGGVVATALSIALVALGSGLGLSSISPWAHDGASAKAVSIGAVIWLILVHAFAAGIGGYVAGRMRTTWVGLHTDEVAFRDTSHGFLVWALSVLITAGLFSAATTAMMAAGVQMGSAAVTATGETLGPVASQASQQASDNNTGSYFVDTLFRTDNPTDATPAAARTESTRILARALADGEMQPTDRSYLAGVVSRQTGLSQPDAEKRVTDVITQARASADKAKQRTKEIADEARKAAANLSFAAFLALFIGAFFASLAATWGAKHRDLP